MKEMFEQPEVELIELAEDVITSSCEGDTCDGQMPYICTVDGE